MTQEEKSEGIVLRSMEYKERQRIVTLFTQNAGLISLIVKGLSKRKLSLFALTTPFCRAEYIYLKGRSELFRFRDGATLDEHLFLRAKLSHLQAAGQLVQALLASQMPGKAAPALYALFSSYLHQLEHFDDPGPIIASFYLKLLKHEGIFSLDASMPLFTLAERSRLAELLNAKSFAQLQTIQVAPELVKKIGSYFLGEIKR